MFYRINGREALPARRTTAAVNLASRRIRVVHVVSTLNIGGLEMVVVNMVRHHNRNRFDLRVICLGELGPLAKQVESLGVSVESIGARPPFTGSASAYLARRIWALRPHVLHTHNPGPHLHGAIAASLARTRVLVHTKHGRNYLEANYSALANRFASRLSSVIVAVSDDAAQVARSIERVPRHKLKVIRNGVDLDRYPFRSPQPDAREVRCVHVARLNWIKDQETLLRAARLVADAEPRFRLRIIGDGPERARLERLIEVLDLQRVVTLCGFREDVASELSEADLFVLSSVSEGISMTLLEAMAAGLPVVATDVGGNREVVVHGETGLLAPAQCPEALARAILSLTSNGALLAEMSYASRRRAQAHFDIRRSVADYERLYDTLIGGL